MKLFKNLLICCCIFFGTTGYLGAQTTPPQTSPIQTQPPPKKDSNDAQVKKQADEIKMLNGKVDSLTKLKTTLCNDCSGELNSKQVFLVFAPLGLLLLVTIIFVVWIRSSNFSLENALSIAPSAKQVAEVIKIRAEAEQSAKATNTEPPVIADPKPQGSVSRLLAFITGIFAIIIAICLVSYHAYAVFAGCGGGDQFTSLWKILAGLGIGVIPYGINVWNGNAKENETTTNP